MGAIVWLASYPKSGNTWLRAFLVNLIADRREPVPFSEYRRYATNEAAAIWFEKHLGGEVRPGQLREVAALRPRVQREIAATGRPLRLVKTHNNLGQVFGHPQINAEVTAAAIYLVRNPLDVVISFAHHNGATIDETIAVMARRDTRSRMRPDRVFEWSGDWSSHVESWTGQPREHLCILRYEDLLDRPQEEFARVAEFLQIDADEDRIRRAVETSSFDRLQRMESETGFDEKPAGVERFFRAGRKDQWREVLTADQRRRITTRHRTQMARFGYL